MIRPVEDSERYRLAALREARDRAERTRRHELSASVGRARDHEGRVLEVEARIDALRAGLASARATWMTRVEHGTTSGRLLLAERVVARLQRQLDGELAALHRVRAALDDIARDADEARDRLRDAQAERTAVERHFEAWREARTKLAERRED